MTATVVLTNFGSANSKRVLRKLKHQAPVAHSVFISIQKANRKAHFAREAEYKQRQEGNEALRDAHALVAQIERDKEDTPAKFWTAENEEDLREALAAVAELKAELEAPPPNKKEAKPTNTAADRALRDLILPENANGELMDVNAYLESQTPLVRFEDYLPDLAGDASAEMLAQVRADHDKELAALWTIYKAPRTMADFERAVDQHIAEHVKAAKPDIRSALLGEPISVRNRRKTFGKIELAKQKLFIGTREESFQLGASLAIALNQKAYRALLLQQAIEMAGENQPVDEAERQKRMAKSIARVIELQRLEEAIIRELEVWGQPVERAHARHPEARLGLRIVGHDPAPIRDNAGAEWPGPLYEQQVITRV